MVINKNRGLRMLNDSPTLGRRLCGAVLSLIFLSLPVVLLPAQLAGARSSAEECLTKGIIEQIGCLSDLAAGEKDASVCDAAAHEGVKYQCYAVAAEKLGHWETCLEIPPKSKEHIELRDVCISDVAENNKDSSLCEEIETRNFRDSCYLKVYRKTGDSALCGKISDPGLKSMCTGEPVYVK
jgi:hypothetical protein